MKKIHIPQIFYVAQLAKEKGMEASESGKRLDDFFKNSTPESEYMTLCQAGSAKKINIQRRLEIMKSIIEGAVAKPQQPPKKGKRVYKKARFCCIIKV